MINSCLEGDKSIDSVSWKFGVNFSYHTCFTAIFRKMYIYKTSIGFVAVENCASTLKYWTGRAQGHNPALYK